MNKLIVLIVTSSITLASSFAHSIEIMPAQQKKSDGAFVTAQKSFDKLAPIGKNLIGKWNCVGAAGYKFTAFCGMDSLEFTKNGNKVDLTLSKKIANKKTVVINSKKIVEMEFSPWPLYEQKSDTYNYVYRKKINQKPGEIDTEIVLINESENFMLSDCTSYGNQILVCKTKGSPNDYSNDESNIKDMQGVWSVFVRENSTVVPQLVVKPSTSKSLSTKK